MATDGSTGQPVPFELPGGGSARVCGKHDSYPAGKDFVDVGIIPDVVVKKMVRDLMNGKGFNEWKGCCERRSPKDVELT
jgi:carboxyl-terminal processing protease